MPRLPEQQRRVGGGDLEAPRVPDPGTTAVRHGDTGETEALWVEGEDLMGYI